MEDTVISTNEEQPVVVRVSDSEPNRVNITVTGEGPAGIQGDPGPQGPPGVGDANYAFTQGAPSASWHVVHNLGKHPSVTVLDSSNSEIEGDITYTNANELTINFSGAFSGVAYMN
jgi:hypothetical protein